MLEAIRGDAEFFQSWAFPDIDGKLRAAGFGGHGKFYAGNFLQGQLQLIRRKAGRARGVCSDDDFGFRLTVFDKELISRKAGRSEG
ncbi:MAG: hypothetical protein P1U87_09155 [Verrucomicrobiales bacterium]|nr:hypothetical protein [Verrucomicrobiales bacterium]